MSDAFASPNPTDSIPRDSRSSYLSELRETALQLRENGVYVLTVNDQKRPTLKTWKDCQTDPPSVTTLKWWFGEAVVNDYSKVQGIACLCTPSKVYVIDFDPDKHGVAVTPFDIDKDFVNPWLEGITSVIDTSTLPRARTGSGGVHFYVRCSGIPPKSAKLALIPTVDRKTHAAIETRGQDSLAILPPSLHPNGKHYRWEHLDITDAPLVSTEQLDHMIAVARGLSRVPEKAKKERRTTSGTFQDDDSVISRYKRLIHPTVILERNGYTDEGDKWLAPGSTSGNPGVVIFEPDDDKPFATVFSHHSDLLGDGHTHDAFDCLAILEHGGDKKAAHQAAAKEIEEHENADKESTDPNDAPRRGLKLTNYFGKGAVKIKPPEMLIGEPFNLPYKYLSALGGLGGTGKSTLAAYLGMCVALGEPFLGASVKQGNTLYLDFESDETGLVPKIDAICRGMNIEPERLEGRFEYVSLATEGKLLRDVFGEVTATIEDQNIKLVIIDAYHAAMGDDPSDSEKVVKNLKPLISLAASQNCTVLFLDHLSKEQKGYQALTLFGSVFKQNLSRTVSILQETSECGILKWQMTKVNLSRKTDPLGILREYTENTDGEEVLRYSLTTLSDDDMDTTKDKIEKAVFLYLSLEAGKQFPRTELINVAVEKSGAAPNYCTKVVGDWLKRNVESGLVKRHKLQGRGNPEAFEIPAAVW